MKPVIIYFAFGHPTPGGRYSDNPRAIYQELLTRDVDFRHVWHTYRPERFPAGVETVVPGTPGYQEALDQAHVIVANAYWENVPMPEEPYLYLQTWHGTPLKHVRHDAPSVKAPPNHWIDLDIANWDYLLSPNAFSSKALPSGLRYKGEVWETGYPRNDILVDARKDERRRQVRETLGIADDQVAVMYAPTWRDNVKTDDGRQAAELKLNVGAFRKRLGDDHVLLLRLHYLIANAFDFSDPGVRNVSDHPESSELYLAADVLITDYSSVMFDFAVTGKPMVFFPYDLADYDSMRGFYFDFLAEAPGPVVHTSDEVIDAIADIKGATAPHADRYRAFREKFCYLEDGHASQRVVDRLLEAYQERF